MATALRVNTSLDAAIAEARERYVARTPKSREQYQRAVESMPGGNTRTVLFYEPYPMTIVRGEGARLWDADGREYIDFLGEFTAGVYGHSHPVIRAAITRALEGGINLAGPNRYEAELARLVCERIPSIELVRFTNSGTEANLMAVATACAHTKKRGVLVFDGGYHGGVFYFSGGGSPVNAPHRFIVAQYNDMPGTAALIDANAHDLAAILLEPMIGGGGCIPAEREFLAMLREKASATGAVLIFDEVMTSRLAPGGLQQRHGVTPDMTTLGKYIGGGMSFGAFGGKTSLMSLYDPRRKDALPHAGTFNNNVLTMSAGVAGMSEVFTPEAQIALNARGDALRERLNELCRRAGAAMQFTGLGSMMTVHFTSASIRRPADVAELDPRLKELFFFDMIEAGFYIARRGMMVLSLPNGDADCDRFAAAVEEFLTSRRALLG
jgi:glutamate-1-semialdehyde 2,1-aminomutase